MPESYNNFFEAHKSRDLFEDNPIKAMEVALEIKKRMKEEGLDI